MVSNSISEIDSIRFNASGTEMQVVLQGGETLSHFLAEIDSVTFEFAANCISTPHSCGAPCVHNPNLSYDTMTDQEGNEYKTIVIGTQEWMAENLKTSIYRNGEAIANVTDNTQWVGLTTGAYCYYNYDSIYDCPYGKLYNWFAAADPRNLCPTGWHVPTDAEWNVLIIYLDPNADWGGNIPNNAGGKMKSIGTQSWFPPNTGATNESGFSGLPSGARLYNQFSPIGNAGYWWSTTEVESFDAWSRFMNYTNGYAYQQVNLKINGFAVRCLRD